MSNFDFSNLQIENAEAWMELPELSPGARILLRPATDANKFYYNALLRVSGARARRMARSDKMHPEDIAKNREEDRQLFPKYVLRGWENIRDRQNNQVPFSRETAKEFCEKIPDWLMDRIRNFAGSPENFTADDQEPDPDPEQLAGN